MRIRVDYTTAYDYARPATGVVQLLHVEPRPNDDLLILDWRVDVDADGSLRSGHDAFGNRTHIFFAEGAIDRLTLRVTGEVITNESHGVLRGQDEALPPLLYRRSTPLTAANPALRAFAHDVGGDEPLSQLHALLAAVHGVMEYDDDATGSGTDAVTSFGLGRGVCQDFSHIFIAGARELGIPARYVSGHFVHGDGDTVRPASHAWAEAFVDGFGWIGFDPTNGISTTQAHVRVAAGLDYLDAAPVRGARRGGGDEVMHVSVRAYDTAAGSSQSQAQSQSQSHGQ